jgi:hypothetical protein
VGIVTTIEPAVGRYGPAGFIAMFANILLMGLSTWMFVGMYMVLVAPPALLIDAGIAFGLSRLRGTVGQIGWGMLVGCLGVLVTIVGSVAVFLVGSAIGL